MSGQSKYNGFVFSDERIADFQLMRYRVAGFDKLSLNQKRVVYYLSEAALCGRDILYSQNCEINLPLRKTLEAILRFYKGDRQSEDFRLFKIYLSRFWFSNGIHHHYSMNKFIPGFSEQFFNEAFLSIPKAELPLSIQEEASSLLHRLSIAIFDDSKYRKKKNLADGDDLLSTSSSTYYINVLQKEAENFYAGLKKTSGFERPAMSGFNTRLVKDPDGTMREEVYKIGGLYGIVLEKIVYFLEKARLYVDNRNQREVLDKLLLFYRIGDPGLFDDYSIAWLCDTFSKVDFINGFIETYNDPLGIKASWESIVHILDEEATERTLLLSDYAQWFENNSPVDNRFKKEHVKGISAKVVETVMLGGDLYPSAAIGINLPNSDWIRAEYGSKSVTIGNLIESYNQVFLNGNLYKEFAIGSFETEMMRKYCVFTGSLHTDLHECIGHGSGQLLPGVTSDSLGVYHSVIEEARADLFSLYYLADPILVSLGLLPDYEAYKGEYYKQIMSGLITQLMRVKSKRDLEEAHMRNRQLIALWALDCGAERSVMKLVTIKNKTYLRINDYSELRSIFAIQLKEIQRIKSEGDFPAAKNLVEKYGVKVDQRLRKEVVERGEKLNIAPFHGFINPLLTPSIGPDGEISDVCISYNESFSEQMLRYSLHYSWL